MEVAEKDLDGNELHVLGASVEVGNELDGLCEEKPQDEQSNNRWDMVWRMQLS
jgi:hypothetical protein